MLSLQYLYGQLFLWFNVGFNAYVGSVQQFPRDCFLRNCDYLIDFALFFYRYMHAPIFIF